MAGNPAGDGEGKRPGDLPSIVNWLAAVLSIAGVGVFALIARAIDYPCAALAIAILGCAGAALWLMRRRRWARAGVIGVGIVTVLALVAVAVVCLTDDPVEDACGRVPSEDAIEVMVVWEDSRELGAFCEVVGAYITSTTGGPVPVEVVSAGEGVGIELANRLAGGDRPDVAIVPQPSLVRELAVRGELVRIEEEVVNRFPDVWNEFVTEQRGGRGPLNEYGAFVKGAYKSLLWYRSDVLGNSRAIEPELWEWEEFTDWARDHLDSETDIAPLTLAAGDRWPLTDWFESQFAGNDPSLYDDLAQADGSRIDWAEVRDAWSQALTQMAELWEGGDFFAGGGQGALETHWTDLADQLYAGDAAVMFGPSFLAERVEEGQEGNLRLYPFHFPELAEGRPIVVGGDIAVIPEQPGRSTTAVAEGFVRWLTGEEALRVWSETDQGYLTPNEKSPHKQDAEPPPDNEDNLRVWLTFQLRHPRDDVLHFDLSDDQFALADESDPNGSWEVFEQFFVDVTEGQLGNDCAVRRAVDRLEAEYKGEDWPPAACDQ